MSNYRCPACGFQIYNRRVRTCESCKTELPQELLLSPGEVAALDAQFEKSKAEREARLKKERRGGDGGSYGGEATWGSSDGGGDCGGDGGGGGD